MDVLVIGFGKIGQIKADIWRSLGRSVYVHDTNVDKLKQAEADGYKVHTVTHRYSDSLIADISTPALYHLHSLKWLLDNVSPLPKSILIEKPLASTEEEITAWMKLLDTETGKDLNRRITVNESYYLSAALDYVASDITEHKYQLKSIETELSKNRLSDVARGRFVDETLGSLGIELPHMIAMVQRFGIRLDDLAIDGVNVYKDNGPHNEGFRLDLSAGDVPITISSYLGDFRLAKTGELLTNVAVIRLLEVMTDSKYYSVEFDPAQGLDRYQAKIRVHDIASKKETVIVLDDNHLTSNLRAVHGGLYDDRFSHLFTPHNALTISRYILKLKKIARYIRISSVNTNQSTMLYSAGKDTI